MQLSRAFSAVSAVSAVFDGPSLVSRAGAVPLAAWAQRSGLRGLADWHLSAPTDQGANAGWKVATLVAGMCAGADSIEDMRLMRHGGMGQVFDRCCAPSTLGSLLRAFTFGHVRQLDAIAPRFLAGLAARSPILPAGRGLALVDVDDTIIKVSGHAKQGAALGFTGVRGLPAMIATVSSAATEPANPQAHISESRLRNTVVALPRCQQPHTTGCPLAR